MGHLELGREASPGSEDRRKGGGGGGPPSPCGARKRALPSGKDADGLSDRGVADRALGLALLADAVSALHAEEVVAAGHQCGDDFALKAHGAIAAALTPQPGGGGGGRGRAGGRAGRGRGAGRVRRRRLKARRQLRPQPIGIGGVGQAPSAWVAAHTTSQVVLARPRGHVQGRGQDTNKAYLFFPPGCSHRTSPAVAHHFLICRWDKLGDLFCLNFSMNTLLMQPPLFNCKPREDPCPLYLSSY